MNVASDLSLSAVLMPLAAYVVNVLQKSFSRWYDEKLYSHFRILVIERVMNELHSIHRAHLEDREHVIRLSDVVVPALIDAGFPPKTIKSVLLEASQDTRGRFSGLISKLAEKVVEDAGVEYGKDLMKRVVRFFEPETGVMRQPLKPQRQIK